MSAAPARPVDCEFRGEHARIDERLKQLEEREATQDGQLEGLREVGGGIREELAGLRGQLQGALAASKVGGAVLGALVSFVASGAIALLVFLLNRGR